MKATIEITEAQAWAAIAALAELAEDQFHYCGCRSHGGHFTRDKSDASGWTYPSADDVRRGVYDTLRGLAAGDGPAGWTTTSGNQVEIFACHDDETDRLIWYVVFDTTRHALRDAGNGVGLIFRALGGTDWAKWTDRNGSIHAVESRASAPWWQAGVAADKAA